MRGALGAGAAVPTLQSLGGEDFAWYLDHVPGAMARLGVKPPGQERPHDLHQGAFDVDESALGVARAGARRDGARRRCLPPEPSPRSTGRAGVRSSRT